MAEVVDLTLDEPLPAPRRRRREPEALVDLTGSQQDGAGAPSPPRQHRRRHQRTHDDELVDLTNSQPDELAGWQAAAVLGEPASKRRRRERDARQQQQIWEPVSARRPQDVQQAQRQREQAQPPQQLQHHSPLHERRHEAAAQVAARTSSPARQAEQQRQEQGQQEQQPCSICFEDVPEMMHSFAACSHAFCLPCLREYISGKVADRAFPVACPLPDCKKLISAAECGLVLTGEEMTALGQMEAEAAVGEGARLFCPNPKCSQLLVADDKRADTPIDCPHCEHKLCANCGVAWHADMTCQQYQAQPGALRSKDDQALLDFAQQAGMRRCPACGVMVERTEGCSYMSCRCGACFCYSCGKRKEPHSNHYCDCKPAAEQWLRPPPGMARALQQFDAQAAQRQARANAAAGQQGVAEMQLFCPI
ncbi:hypothetical protein ABPG75_010884 [Micractinium tetrahymenae]